MKKSFRKFGLICSLFAFATGLVFGVKNLQPVSANSAPDFESVGASVRTVDPTGLRFIFSVDKQYKDAGYSYGTLIIPKVILGENTLNHNDDTADEIDLNYTPVSQEKWATEAYKEIKAEDETHFYEDGREYFNAVMTKIPEAYYGTTLVARAYAVKDGVYYYSAPVERSMAQVAAYALQNGEEGELLTKYVDTALANQTLTMNVTTAYMATDSEQSFDVLNDNDYSAIWTSSNTDVATVDNNGKVTAVAEGKATITAKLGTKTTSAEVQVGAPIEGDVVFKVNEKAGNGIVPEYSNTSSLEVLNDTTVFGQSIIKHTTGNHNGHTAVKIPDMFAFDKYQTLQFKVYGHSNSTTPYGTDDHFVRIRAVKNGESSNSTWAETRIPKGEWVTVTLDLTKIDLSKGIYIQHGTTWFDTVDGQAGKQGGQGDYIYISDIYGVNEMTKLVSMQDAISNGAFKAKNTNSTVSYSTDYTAFDAGMAKIYSNISTQAYGYYCQSLDVSAYYKITFKVFRPASHNYGYYVRVKTGTAFTLINSDATTSKSAGVWYNITLNVSDVADGNLNEFYIQFGTDTTNMGDKDRYIYVSDIYGIK